MRLERFQIFIICGLILFLVFWASVTQIEVATHAIGKVVPTVQKFGGEYLVRAGEYKVIDGEWKYPRTVVIKFPTYEKALEWYDSEEYKPVKPIRLANSVANGIIIKGV